MLIKVAYWGRIAPKYGLKCSTRRWLTVATAPSPSSSATANESFKNNVFLKDTPSVMRRGAGSPAERILALSKWITGSGSLSPQLLAFENWVFPYEIIAMTSDTRQDLSSFVEWLLKSGEDIDKVLSQLLDSALVEAAFDQFLQMHAPLRLLVKAIEFNKTEIPTKPLQIYIAQSSLAELPELLQSDLKAPGEICEAGNGDIYSSSIWLGTEPTYTPLHRDPNPNLFCQLFGIKSVRLLHPSLGHSLFHRVQRQIGQQGSSYLRTSEMMQGVERKALHHAVWESEAELDNVYEVAVHPGDSLFIPTGWWHSVKSKGSSGALNMSANWWFR